MFGVFFFCIFSGKSSQSSGDHHFSGNGFVSAGERQLSDRDDA